MLLKRVSWGVFALIVLTVVFGSWGTVGAGERGVKLRLGAATNTILQPGLYLKLPLFESVVKIDVQTQVESVAATAASKDLQDVSADVGLNYSVNSTEVSQLYREIGTEYKTKIIDPAIQDAVKASTAKFTAEELITKREEVKDNIVEVLKVKFNGQHLNIISLNITNFKFSASFNTAIENKVTAEQNALASKNQLEQVKYEAQQTIEKAKAQAESIRIQAQSINSQGGADYVQLQAVNKWDGKLPTQMIPGGTVPFLNLK